MGSTTLTATSSTANPAAWSVSVPANAAYITESSVSVTVSASKTGFAPPSDVTRTLVVDLTAPSARTYTAPASLQVNVAITTMNPSSTSDTDIAGYSATGLPSGLGIDAGTGAISGTPDTADSNTRDATVTITDDAGNTRTASIAFPAVAKADQTLTGFAYSRNQIVFGDAAPTVTPPTGAQTSLEYSAAPSGVCTVDVSTGVLTIAGAGTCTITATAVSTSNYNEATATFELTVQEARAPGAPGNFVAQASQTKAALRWSAPGDTGTSALTGYTLYRGGGASCNNLSALQSSIAPDTTYVEDTAVTSGDTYCYQVTASNSAGESAPSASAAVTALTPGAPTEMNAISRSDSAIALGWTAPADDGGGPLDGYNLYRCLEEATACTPAYLAWVPLADGATYTDNAVTTDSQYRYAVGASRVDASSDWSNEITVIASDPTAPPAPTGFRAQGSETTVALSWAALTGSITAYTLYRGDGNGCDNLGAIQTNLAGDTTYVEDTTVASNQTYCYQVSATNDVGEGDRSRGAVVATVTPGPPRNLSVTSRTDTAVVLNWTAPADDDGGPLDGYNLFRCEESGGSCTPEYHAWAPVANGTTYRDESVASGRDYRYAVGATRLDGSSDWSNEVSTARSDPPPPPPPVLYRPGTPTDLSAQSSATRAALAWTAPARYGNDAPTHYLIYRGRGNACANLGWLASPFARDGTYYEDDTVAEGETYCYRVSASNSAGEGERSHAAVVTALKPAAPVGLLVTSTGDTAIGLGWSVPPEDGGGELDGYNLFRCEEGETACTPAYYDWIPGQDGTTYEDEGITQEMKYRYAVGSSRVNGVSDWSNEVTATATDEPPGMGDAPAVWLFPHAGDEVRQGFARVINHSLEDGTVDISPIDDAGMRYGPVELSIGAGKTVHFNSGDLESGNPDKGLTDGVGTGQGDWRLTFETALDIEVLSYIRTRDGFLTAMHDVAPTGPDGLTLVTFNPASNLNQASRLRLINPGEADAGVTITGVDDAGDMPGEGVRLSIPAGASATLAADVLESGSGLDGSLGDGRGKWRLEVTSDAGIVAMSLLENMGTGHLTNLSTAPPVNGDGIHAVPLFPAASDASGRQGFARVANRSGEAGVVRIQAYDESATVYEPLALSLDAGETAHFNSDDLELGNAGKGLTGSTGAGTGDWRLELTSDLVVEVYSYIRTADGFLTAMHDRAPRADDVYRVVTLNPGSNLNQASTLRLNNEGALLATVTVLGIDDAGESHGGEVRLSMPAGAVRAYTAAALEAGGEGIEGALGDGAGKWRLRLATDVPLTVMSLVESPGGHLSNLSTAPQQR